MGMCSEAGGMVTEEKLGPCRYTDGAHGRTVTVFKTVNINTLH